MWGRTNGYTQSLVSTLQNGASILAGGNLVLQPHFESGVLSDKWAFTDYTSIVDVPVPHPNGRLKCLRLGRRNQYLATSEEEGGYIQYSPEGRTFRVSGWCYNTSDYDAKLGVNIKNNDGSFQEWPITTIASGNQTDWIYAYAFVTVTETQGTRFRPFMQIAGFGTGADMQYAHWTDISIEDVTESFRAGEAADASVVSASLAATSANDAGVSAAAADTDRLAAETAKADSEAARDISITSQTAAESAESSALASANLAAASETNAGTQATAAASSASVASTKANEASTSAVAADTYKIAAQTAQQAASVSQTAAATSETNAAGSASTATTQATVAVGAVAAATPPSTFEDESTFFSGDASIGSTPLRFSFLQSGDTKVAQTTDVAQLSTLGPKGLRPNRSDSVWRIRALVRHVSGTAAGVELRLEEWSGTSTSSTRSSFTGEQLPVSDTEFTWIEWEFSIPTAVAVRPVIVMNYPTSSAVQEISALDMVDVTDVVNLGAQVETTSTAVADINGKLSATYSIKVGAGGAASLLELVASDDPTGPTSSFAKISAADILLDGTVTASKVLVTNLENLFTAGGFEAENLDAIYPSTDAVVGVSTISVTGGTSLSLGKNSLTDAAYCTFNATMYAPVKAGETYLLETEARALAGTATAGFYFRVHWYSNDKTYLSYNVVISDAGLTTAWQVFSKQIVAPATAAYANMRLYNNSTNTVVETFLIDRAVLRTANAASLIVDGGIVAKHLAAGSVTADKIVAGSITTDKLNVNDIAISGEMIAQGAVSRTYVGTKPFDSETVTSTTSFVIIDPWNVNFEADQNSNNPILFDVSGRVGNVTMGDQVLYLIIEGKIAGSWYQLGFSIWHIIPSAYGTATHYFSYKMIDSYYDPGSISQLRLKVKKEAGGSYPDVRIDNLFVICQQINR